MYLRPLPIKAGNDHTSSEANEMVCLEDDSLTPHMRSALKHLNQQAGLMTTHTKSPIEVSRLDQWHIAKLCPVWL